MLARGEELFDRMEELCLIFASQESEPKPAQADMDHFRLRTSTGTPKPPMRPDKASQTAT